METLKWTRWSSATVVAWEKLAMMLHGPCMQTYARTALSHSYFWQPAGHCSVHYSKPESTMDGVRCTLIYPILSGPLSFWESAFQNFMMLLLCATVPKDRRQGKAGQYYYMYAVLSEDSQRERNRTKNNAAALHGAKALLCTNTAGIHPVLFFAEHLSNLLHHAVLLFFHAHKIFKLESHFLSKCKIFF